MKHGFCLILGFIVNSGSNNSIHSDLLSGKVRIFIIWLSDALTRITDSDLEENLNMKLA